MANCPRWIKTGATKQFESEDMVYPDSLTEKQVMDLPEHVAETYEECAGTVPCTYSYDPGCYRTSNGDGWPPSEDFEVGSCDACGAENWSEAEEDDFLEYERNSGADYDDRDDPRDDR